MCGKSDSQISLKAPAFAPRGGGGAEARADEEALAAAGAEVGPSAAEGPEAGGASHAAEEGPGAGGSQAGHAAGAEEELPAPWSPPHPPAQLWRPRFQSADL
jgi:hypothetical protein